MRLLNSDSVELYFHCYYVIHIHLSHYLTLVDAFHLFMVVLCGYITCFYGLMTKMPKFPAKTLKILIVVTYHFANAECNLFYYFH